jgi:hypothetical protein
MRRRPKRLAATAFAIAFAAVNVSAYLHAYSMTHFVEAGRRTPSPESLGFLAKANVLVSGVQIPRPTNHVTPNHVGLDFDVRRFDGADGTSYEAWYVPGPPSAPLALLFHGYSESKARLLDEAKAFHELGFGLLLVDFRGSGGSSGHETTIGYREADDVAAAMAYARDRLARDRPILYGRSMGSAAVLRAVSALQVEAAAIILESPFDRLLSTVKNRFSAMGIPSFPCSELLVFWGGVQQGYSGFAHNPVEYASAVTCPALLLHGSRDPRATINQARSVFEQLAGAKTLVEFTNAGHEPCLKVDPQRWKQAVGGFLGRSPGQARAAAHQMPIAEPGPDFTEGPH